MKSQRQQQLVDRIDKCAKRLDALAEQLRKLEQELERVGATDKLEEPKDAEESPERDDRPDQAI